MDSSVEIGTKGLILVSGPTKSGKSKWAENLISKQQDIIYVATSELSSDKEFQRRIEEHKSRRPHHWELIEGDFDLLKVIKFTKSTSSLIIDSLGGFIAKNIELDESQWIKLSNSFLEALKPQDKLIIIVIEETGWGVVPSTSIGNKFRDRLGKLSQELNSISILSWLVIQGRAINLTLMGQKV